MPGAGESTRRSEYLKMFPFSKGGYRGISSESPNPHLGVIQLIMITTADLSKYSAFVKLRHGQVVEIRAIRLEDRDELLRTVGRASRESLYTRFFSPKREFTEGELDYFLKVDFEKHVALVAVVEEDGRQAIAGGGRYIVSAAGSAELAFGLNDEYQGRGIASALMRHLTGIARSAGIEEFHADVLPDNLAMLRVFEKSGLEISLTRDEGTVHVTMRLHPPLPAALRKRKSDKRENALGNKN